MGGMFKKDKEYGGTRLDEWATEGEPFILFNAGIVSRDVETSVGKARRTALVVAALDKDGNAILPAETVFTLASAIADKVEDAEPTDFPSLVTTGTVASATYETDAYVLSYAGPYAGKPVKDADVPPLPETVPAAN